MERERKQLFDHPINQRLAALYVIYVLLAVVLLGLHADHGNLGFLLLAIAFVAACIVLTRLVARCPACGKDSRFHHVTPIGARRLSFANINWFAPNCCPHCRRWLTKQT